MPPKPPASDDGVGLPHRAVVAKVGLGTTIVQALARQLQAETNATDTAPGTSVSIAHQDARVVPGSEAKAL